MIFLGENRFLQAVFDNYPLTNIHFRLIPVYTLYMTIRHRLSPFGKANLSAIQKQEDVLSLLYLIENIINQKIEVNFLCFIISYVVSFFLSRNIGNMLDIFPIG